MEVNKSIIRNGNHFIYLDNAGWVLIDGPWFDKLPDRLKSKYFHVHKYSPMPLVAWTDELEYATPTHAACETIIWEAIYWLPGYRSPADPYLAFKYRTEILIKYRAKLGWRIYPDGQLPIYFNALEWQPEMERDYNLNY